MLGLIATALAAFGGKETKLPLYSEIAHPERNEKKQEQTADEAREQIYKSFGFIFPKNDQSGRG